MSFKGINKEDYGARFLSREGLNKYIGNACFFCCLYAALIDHFPDDFSILSFTYEDFLEAGGWNKEFKGKMVDTYTNAENLHKVASRFGVRIIIYTELAPNIAYADAYNRFGSDGPIILIVKILNSAHFNLMKWTEDPLVMEEVEIAQKKLQKQLKKDREYALQVEEQLSLQYEQEQKDAQLATELVIKLEAEDIQISNDAKLARKLASSVY